MIIVSAICIQNSARPEVSKGQPSRSCFDTLRNLGAGLSTNGHDLAETMIGAREKSLLLVQSRRLEPAHEHGSPLFRDEAYSLGC